MTARACALLPAGTFFSNKELVVLQTGDKLTLVTNSPFGMQRLDYTLDDRVRTARTLHKGRLQAERS